MQHVWEKIWGDTRHWTRGDWGLSILLIGALGFCFSILIGIAIYSALVLWG